MKKGLTGKVYEVKVNHQYYIRGGFMGGEIKSARHACLQHCWWCWKNALRYPQDIIPYLRRKYAKN